MQIQDVVVIDDNCYDAVEDEPPYDSGISSNEQLQTSVTKAELLLVEITRIRRRLLRAINIANIGRSNFRSRIEHPHIGSTTTEIHDQYQRQKQYRPDRRDSNGLKKSSEPSQPNLKTGSRRFSNLFKGQTIAVVPSAIANSVRQRSNMTMPSNNTTASTSSLFAAVHHRHRRHRRRQCRRRQSLLTVGTEYDDVGDIRLVSDDDERRDNADGGNIQLRNSLAEVRIEENRYEVIPRKSSRFYDGTDDSSFDDSSHKESDTPRSARRLATVKKRSSNRKAAKMYCRSYQQQQGSSGMIKDYDPVFISAKNRRYPRRYTRKSDGVDNVEYSLLMNQESRMKRRSCPTKSEYSTLDTEETVDVRQPIIDTFPTFEQTPTTAMVHPTFDETLHKRHSCMARLPNFNIHATLAYRCREPKVFKSAATTTTNRYHINQHDDYYYDHNDDRYYQQHASFPSSSSSSSSSSSTQKMNPMGTDNRQPTYQQNKTSFTRIGPRVRIEQIKAGHAFVSVSSSFKPQTDQSKNSDNPLYDDNSNNDLSQHRRRFRIHRPQNSIYATLSYTRPDVIAYRDDLIESSNSRYSQIHPDSSRPTELASPARTMLIASNITVTQPSYNHRNDHYGSTFRGIDFNQSYYRTICCNHQSDFVCN